MSKRCKRVKKHRRNWLSDTFSNLKNLLSNGHEFTVAKVFHRADNRAILRNDDGKRICSNFKKISTKDRRYADKNIHGGASGYLKRCRRSQRPNDRTKSRKRRKVSRSEDSDSYEDSGSASSSNSDLRSTSRNVNRNILSRLVQYTFYFVINTGVTMDQGTSASALCRSFLALYLKLDENSVYSNFLDHWDKAGQKIIVLKGYNHKHLQYLAKEVRHIAVESNTLYRTTGQARVMLVLSAFGREEDMEEAFDDLCYLH